MRRLQLFSLLFSTVCASGTPAPTPARAKVVPNSPVSLKAPLRAAIGANDASAIASLMKRGARPDDAMLDSALYRANAATWKALLNGGLSANARFKRETELGVSTVPLIVAVAENAASDDRAETRALLRLLIARGADVNARAPGGATALFVATQNSGDEDGDGQVAQILLDAGARVQGDDIWLLFYAARIGNPELLQRALRAGVVASGEGARKSHLLQNALDIRRLDDESGAFNPDTPSFIQAHNARRAQVVAALLDAGAEVNDLDELGQSPLMLAADGGLRPALVELLLKHGADPNLQRPQGPTIWDYAAPLRLWSARQIQNAFAVDMMAFGLTPLGSGYRATTAAEVEKRQSAEDTRTLELLLQAGAPLELRDPDGQTLLMLCAGRNRAATLGFLLARGADLKAADHAGNTALLLAAGSDSPAAIAALLNAGAALEARDKNGLTPLLMAAGAGVEGVTSYAPFGAVIQGYGGGPEALRVLVTRGANPNARDARGLTALHWMASVGDTADAQLLVKRGANVNARADKATTPLHIAVSKGDYSMSKLLLQLGADATARTEAGQTPLDIALSPYHTQIKAFGEDPAHPSRETQKMSESFAKSDRQITARRAQIAELLRRGR